MNGPSPHRSVNPDTLQAARGYAHATVAAAGRQVYLGGQTGHGPDGGIAEGMVEQFDQAVANVVEALRAAGAQPEHLVQMVIYTTDLDGYRHTLKPIGEAYRRHLGKHYPAMALIGVSELFDPRAKVELIGVAVVPER